VITLDTSAVLALLRTQDREHAACRAIVEADRGPLIIPVAVLAEIMCMLEATVPDHVVESFLEDLISGTYEMVWQEADLARVLELEKRYRDLRLGFADSAVIACAERHGGQVLTLNRRDFPVVARGERTITVLPSLT
jgi:predicted nucleic acid-binding protein